MLNIYLPVAESSVDSLGLLALGGSVGFLSGIFGVGGGFLLTPLLIFMGIAPPVAVATGANHVLGSSVSGVIVHWRRRNVDVKMGTLLLAGGLVGSGLGVWLFAVLKRLGHIDLVISLSYVGLLVTVGGLMLTEAVRATLGRGGRQTLQKRHLAWHAWPFRMRFPRSQLYISAIPPLLVGLFSGILSAILGVGGGFLIVPLMIYTLAMPTTVVVGTSLFQIIFVTAGVTFLQAVTTHTVDAVLAAVLLVGGAVGAQFGARVGAKLRSNHLRLLLALLVLVVGFKMAWDLMSVPDDLFILSR